MNRDELRIRESVERDKSTAVPPVPLSPPPTQGEFTRNSRTDGLDLSHVMVHDTKWLERQFSKRNFFFNILCIGEPFSFTFIKQGYL